MTYLSNTRLRPLEWQFELLRCSLPSGTSLANIADQQWLQVIVDATMSVLDDRRYGESSPVIMSTRQVELTAHMTIKLAKLCRLNAILINGYSAMTAVFFKRPESP